MRLMSIPLPRGALPFRKTTQCMLGDRNQDITTHIITVDDDGLKGDLRIEVHYDGKVFADTMVVRGAS